MYYVYEWFIVETGEIVYVGKGTRNRYKVRKHNRFFNDMLKRYNCESRIVKEFDTEKEAFSYEFIRVQELKSQGQCVCNIHDGGYGGSDKWWNDEMRERYSERNAMKSDDQRKRMSADNPMKRKEVAEKVNSQKRIPVIVGNKRYESVKKACESYGVPPATLNAWCTKGFTKDGDPCRYEDAEKKAAYYHRNDGQKRAVIYKGKMYESSTALGIAIGVSQTTAARWCRQGRDSYGDPCRYVDDNRSETTGAIKQKCVPVIVNDVWYPSKEHASRVLGISSYLITQYLEGKKRDEKYICKHG